MDKKTLTKNEVLAWNYFVRYAYSVNDIKKYNKAKKEDFAQGGDLEKPGMGGYDEAIIQSSEDKLANTIIDNTKVAKPFRAIGEGGSNIIIGDSVGESRKKKQVLAAAIFAPHKLWAMRKARAEENAYAKGGDIKSLPQQLVDADRRDWGSIADTPYLTKSFKSLTNDEINIMVHAGDSGVKSYLNNLIKGFGYKTKFEEVIREGSVHYYTWKITKIHAKGGILKKGTAIEIVGDDDLEERFGSNVMYIVNYTGDGYFYTDAGERSSEWIDEEDLMELLKTKKVIVNDLYSVSGFDPKEESYAKGGEIDLFENYKILPQHIRDIMDFYMDKYDEGAYDYNDSKEFLEKMEKEGYTFEYGLDNEPYNLRKMHSFAEGGEVSLYFNQGSSDKEYHVQLEEVDGGYIVNFQYGRRGSALKAGTKTSTPVSLPEAQKIYDKLINSKVGKGYIIDASNQTNSTDYSSTPRATIVPKTVHKLPQLLNIVFTEKEFINDDSYLAQEKRDGERRMVVMGPDGIAMGLNKKGQEVPLPNTIINSIDMQCTIDGEIIGDTLYAFDILSIMGENLEGDTCVERISTLNTIHFGEGVIVVETAYNTEEKQKMFDKLKRENREGIVFKKKDAPYTVGRPNSGGNQLKYKFYKTATFIVANHTPGKRSVGLELIDNGQRKFMGKVTIPPNKEIPNVGDLVEVRYLYAYKDGAVYQPTYIWKREDSDLTDATIDQIIYKPEDFAKGGKITDYHTALGTIVGQVGKNPKLAKYKTKNTIRLGEIKDLGKEGVIKLANSLNTYAKGGALSKEFKFDKNFVIYVPSTSDVGNKISQKELDKRVEEVERFVANEFGGYTETDTDGGYKANSGEIIEEDIVKVSVFAGNKQWKTNENQVVAKVKQWAKEWGQEAIGFEYEGDLYYIDDKGKFAKGGEVSKDEMKSDIEKIKESRFFSQPFAIQLYKNGTMQMVTNKDKFYTKSTLEQIKGLNYKYDLELIEKYEEGQNPLLSEKTIYPIGYKGDEISLKEFYGKNYWLYRLKPKGESFKTGGLTSKKARKMLKDGMAQGKPLTDKQKRYFGAIAGGKEDNVRKRARMERGGKLNVDKFMPILPLSGKNLIVNDITFLENELTKTTDVLRQTAIGILLKKKKKERGK